MMQSAAHPTSRLRALSLVTVGVLLGSLALAPTSALANSFAAAVEEPAAVAFVAPTQQQLAGLVDVEVTAPAGTKAVQFSMDGVAFAEVTDAFSTASKLAPSWRTATDASWFDPGAHTLVAEAIAADGTVTRAEKSVITVRPTAPAGQTSLDGAWSFATESELPAGALDTATPPVASDGFDLSAATSTVVPSSFGAVRDQWNSYDGQRAAYRRTVDLPTAAGDQRTWLVFESCYFECRYFVNGTQVGQSRGGYLPIRLDVTAAAREGADTVTAIVDNRLSTIRQYGIATNLYWHFGGLLQSVRVEQTKPVQVHDITADGTAAGALTLRANAVNTSGASATVPATVTVTAPDGTPVITAASVQFTVPAGGGESSAATLQVANPVLWSLENPALYTVAVTTQGQGEGSARAGFRTVTVLGPNLLLNGVQIDHLKGTNRHADYPGLGRTIPDGLAHRELGELHGRGFQLLRAGHYPTTPALLDAADELGILMVEEVNVHQASATALASAPVRQMALNQLKEMIARDRSHPSIITWSVGNENNTATTQGAEYVRDLIAAGRSQDSSRLYTQVSDKHNNDLSYEYQDIVLANIYAGTYYSNIAGIISYVDRTQEKSGGKPVIVSEYGTETVPGREGTGSGTEAYQALMIDEYNRLLEARPGTTGWMYWPSEDFWVSPNWSGGNPQPTPPFHMKALRTFDREPKLGWKVMFSPVRIAPLPPMTVSGDARIPVELDVTISGIGDEPATGHIVVEPPTGLTAPAGGVPFQVEPGATTTVTVPLAGHLDPFGDVAVGTVRAVIDEETEAAPKTFSVIPSGAGAAIAIDAGPANTPVLDTYSQLTAATNWDPARGFGWVSTQRPNERDRGGPDALRRDYLGGPAASTLRVAVPAGQHTLRVLVGDQNNPTRSTVVSADGAVVAQLPAEIGAGKFSWITGTIDGGATGRDVDLVFSQTNDWWRLNALLIDDVSSLELSATAQTRCVVSKAYVVVSVTNEEDAPVDIRIETPYGVKTFPGVAPGKNAVHAFNSRAGSIPAGAATVEATGTGESAGVTFDESVEYAAKSCG